MRVLEGRARIEDLDAFLGVLDEMSEEFGVTVQAFDARYVVSRAHLERALARADRARARGENVADDRGVEVLLYAAGTRQIDRALTMGVREGEGPVVLLVDADPAGEGADESADEEREASASERERGAVAALRDRLALDPAETLGDYDPDRVREFFDVGDAELDAVAGDLADLVLERVALLDVEK